MKIKRGDIEGTLGAYMQFLVLRGLLDGMKLFPYSLRLKLIGTLTSRIIGPFAGYNTRVKNNLNLIFPDMPAADVRHMMRAVPANAGRTLAEIYSGKTFKAHAIKAKISGGEGYAAMEAAKANGQGVIFVSGHFGNYDVPRAAFSHRGFNMGGLYKEFRNPFFNAYYCDHIGAISQPIFPTKSRKGMSQMIRFLRGGGMLGMLIDVHSVRAPVLSFFGKRASTPVSAAEIALKYDLVLIPTYGIRLDDAGTYEVQIEPPIAHTNAEQMTQDINDSLERQVRAHMDQYFWIHRRWKAETPSNT
jgi:KDO2-lipid IV(A) lauroyltransferase